MALWTAQYRYSGADRCDITAKANNIFSPPWKLVSAYKNAEARAALCDEQRAEEIMNAAKRLYEIDYFANLQKNVNTDLNGFNAFIEYIRNNDLTMVCFCNVKKTGFCHRLLVAERLQSNYSIQYNGEREL